MKRLKNQKGFSVVNLMTTLGLIAILSTMAISNMKEINDPLVDASFQIEHFMRLARARAISQTIAVQVAPISTFRIGTSSSTACTGTMTAMNDLFLDLPNGASLSATTWTVCFSQRGLANANVTFNLTDTQSNTKTVEVALGGGVKIQ